MKIVTWNVWNKNLHTDLIADFLEKSNADIIAFQELTQEHIDVLAKNNLYTFRLAKDFSEAGEMTFLGLFSRFPIVEEKTIGFTKDQVFSPSIVGRAMQWKECIEAHSVTIENSGVKTTVVNLHLTCAASPTTRLSELVTIVDYYRDCKSLIICGDFNTFGFPLLNILIGWRYGFGLEDYPIREVPHLCSWAAKHNLSLVKNKAPTFSGHRFLGFRFDHFLIRGITAASLNVSLDAYGSDHYPVIIETTPI